jgi:hypothetical protein
LSDWRDHLWKPGEREAMLADIAERSEADAAEPWQRRPEPEPKPATPSKAAAEPTMPTQDQLWQAWIDKRIAAAIKTNERAITGAIVDALAEERGALLKQIAELRERIEQLEARPNGLRAVG